MNRKLLRWSLVVGSLLIIWQMTVGENSFLATPLTVFETFAAQLGNPEVKQAVFSTTYRVLISSAIALVLGIFIGTLDYFSETFSDLINALFYPTQFVSEAVLTLLAVTLVGLSPAIIYVITVIAILPDLFVVIREGLKDVDRKLIEFGQVYSDSNWRIFRYLIIPQLLPYILSGFLRAHATAWDIVATVEIFLIAGGLGELTQNYYQLLDLPKLFSTVLIILLMGLTLDGFFRAIKRRIDKRYLDGKDTD